MLVQVNVGGGWFTGRMASELDQWLGQSAGQLGGSMHTWLSLQREGLRDQVEGVSP